jgi:hypothetical protein
LRSKYHDSVNPERFVTTQKKWIAGSGMSAIPAAKRRPPSGTNNIFSNDQMTNKKDYLDMFDNNEVSEKFDEYWKIFQETMPQKSNETRQEYIERVGDIAVSLFKSFPENRIDREIIKSRINEVAREKQKRETDIFRRLNENIDKLRDVNEGTLLNQENQAKKEYLEQREIKIQSNPRDELEMATDFITNRIETKAIAADVAMKERLIKDNPGVYGNMLNELLEADQLRRDKIASKQDNDIKIAILGKYPQLLEDMKLSALNVNPSIPELERRKILGTVDQKEVAKLIYDVPLVDFIKFSKKYLDLKNPSDINEAI